MLSSPTSSAARGDRRNCKNVDIERTQDLFSHASQKNLGDTRAAVRADNQEIGIRSPQRLQRLSAGVPLLPLGVTKQHR